MAALLSIADQLAAAPHWVKEPDMPVRCEKVKKGQRMEEVYQHMVKLRSEGILRRNTAEVAIDLGITGTVASHALRRLVEFGRLVKEGEVKRGGVYVGVWMLPKPYNPDEDPTAGKPWPLGLDSGHMGVTPEGEAK